MRSKSYGPHIKGCTKSVAVIKGGCGNLCNSVIFLYTVSIYGQKLEDNYRLKQKMALRKCYRFYSNDIPFIPITS